jgi:hypothetical protein
MRLWFELVARNLKAIHSTGIVSVSSPGGPDAQGHSAHKQQPATDIAAALLQSPTAHSARQWPCKNTAVLTSIVSRNEENHDFKHKA